MAVVTAVIVAVVTAVTAGWLARPDGRGEPLTAAPIASASTQVQTAQAPPTSPTSRSTAPRTSAPRPSVAPPRSSAPRPSVPPPQPPCATVAHAFDPRTITVPGGPAGAVITPPREADGVPGVPPLSRRGKTVFAWDREQGIRPGDPAGHVLLNAHTWPDGSALGNRLLAGLQRGDQIVAIGDNVRLCYRVTERIEVLAARGLPRYYAKDGPPQLAIVVCSGRRLGPGHWEKRTIWFASPSA